MKIICLANSFKHGHFCVAGIDPVQKRWIRPISKHENGELSKERSLVISHSGVRQIQPLDIVDLGTLISRPLSNQPENHLCGEQSWELIGVSNPNDLIDYVSNSEFIFQGQTDRISLDSLDESGILNSLMLIKVSNPIFFVRTVGQRQQLRARFDFCDIEYNFSVTDTSDWTQAARSNPERFSSGDWLFTISLGVPFHGDLYKLIACGIKI